MEAILDNAVNDLPETDPQPSVTVIVLNYNGAQHLEPCFTSLAQLDYPAAKLELMLVDNASVDNSLELMREKFPAVRVVRSAENLGFAGGNNFGVEAATTEYVVFLNNDMKVDPGFLQALVAVRRSDPAAVCVGAKILNWDGSRIDFGAAAAHFAGYAYQLGYDQPHTPDRFNEVRPVLFACGGAMLIHRQIFLDAGGFDRDFFAVYEDLDLGWRLWLLGWKVLVAPQALVYHRHHGTLNSIPDHRKQLLYKRNALYAAIKNYSDEHVGRVLATAALGVSHGVVEHARSHGYLFRSDFDLGSSVPDPRVQIDKHEAAALLALNDVVLNMPALMEKRARIQARRRRTDEEVGRLFKWPFRFWPDVSARVQYVTASAFQVQEVFAELPRRVLIISSDILPFPGLPTVGSGLRAWGIGQGLASRGHEVLYSMPKQALRGREHQIAPEVAELAWEIHTLLSVVRLAEPDVVVVCNWPVMALLPTEDIGVPVVLDQHGPHFMEREYQKAGDPKENAYYKILALQKADYFTCAGYKQLGYFQSWLERAGWTERERRECASAIPVSLSPDLPAREPDAELSFVYGGVFLPWQDPTAGLNALVETLDRRETGRLYFYGGRHPVYPVDPGLFETLLAQLKQSAHVTAPGMVSHDELIERYTRSHVAMDVMKRNPERELAFTTRTVEYLWCGLPVIYQDYSELSDYIREYEAGWTVDPEDTAAIHRILDEILAHPEEVVRRSQNAQRLVRERLTWDKTIEPLDHFVRRPTMRARAFQSGEPADRPAVVVGGRTLKSMLRTAWAIYRHQGVGVLWRETWSFLRQQVLRG